MTHGGWRFPAEHRHLLSDEDRRSRLQPDRVLAQAGVRVGEVVVDLGAGTGLWTAPLAALVGPAGRVYAVDVEPIMLEEIRTLIRERGLTNVEAVPMEAEAAVPLPEALADLILLAFVLHEPADPEAFLHEVVRLLKPDGRVLVMEWQDWPTEIGPPVEVRISREETIALLDNAGLLADDLESPTPDAYVLLAREFHPGDAEPVMPTV
jgi:ubiquinone/menaquinone biosynthesis C-methylase UbiE